MKKLIAVMLACVFVGAALADPPKYTTKQVMKEAFKGGLIKKVIGGTASDEEKAKVLSMLEAMSMNEVKKGPAESWKMKTAALVKAAKAGNAAALKAAANCGACHKVHK